MKDLLKPTIKITILSFCGILLSFISQLLVAYYFGTSSGRDAYFSAIVLPTYFVAILTGSIGFVFLPKVIELKNINEDSARKFINTVLVATTLVMVVLIFLGLLFSESILKITAPGFNAEMIVYTQNLFRILLFSSMFFVLTNLISYLYQIKKKFVRTALAPLISIPIGIFFIIILNSHIGIMSLAIGTLLGSIISLLMVLPILFTKEFRFDFHIDVFDSNFFSTIKLCVPLLLGGIVFRSAPVFERMIASELESGSISILGYSAQLISTLSTIATSGIVISFFPSMSEAWIKDTNLFNQYFNKGILIILLLIIPIAFSFVLYGDVFIQILLERGAFTHQDTLALSETFALMTPALVMLCLGGITSKIYYISKRTLDLTIISSFELVSYLSLTYFLSRYYGYIGIAIGTSLAYSLFMLVYFFYGTIFILKKYNHKMIFIESLKIILISVFSFIFSYLFYTVVSDEINKYWALIFSLLIAFILYLFLLYKFKNLEIISFVQKLKKLKNN
jgi:putative peptidoglycan lipid II flippase